jgi:hypothetical protein
MKNKDVHMLNEMYRTIREQDLAGFGVSQQTRPAMGQFGVTSQQGVTPSLTQMNSAMQSVGNGMDNMKANKLMDELMKDMGIDVKYKGELIKLAIALAQKSVAAKK